jgi:hypothetical protein
MNILSKGEKNIKSFVKFKIVVCILRGLITLFYWSCLRYLRPFLKSLFKFSKDVLLIPSFATNIYKPLLISSQNSKVIALSNLLLLFLITELPSFLLETKAKFFELSFRKKITKDGLWYCFPLWYIFWKSLGLFIR